MNEEFKKNLRQCFHCLQAIPPKKDEKLYDYMLRRYCGPKCVDGYIKTKQARDPKYWRKR